MNDHGSKFARARQVARTNGRTKFYSFALVAIGGAALLSYQNCGELRPSNEAVSSQSSYEFRYIRDKQTLDRLKTSPTLKVWISAKESLYQTSGGQASSISSLNNDGVTLTPGSSETGPSIVSSPALGNAVFEFRDNRITKSPTSSPLIGSAYSMIALVEGPVSGRLITINAGTVGTDERTVSVDGGFLTAKRQRTAGQSEELKTAFDGTLSRATVVAVSFDDAPGRVLVQVDGRVARDTVEKTGDPEGSTSSSRYFTLGGTGSAFKVAEVLVINEALSQAELNTVSRYVGERWGLKDIYFDPELFPIGGPGSTDDLPPAVRTIINNKCANCHSGAHTAWYNFKADDFKKTGRVVPGNAIVSPVYYRLQVSDAPGDLGAKDMPQGGSISAAESEAIKNWIQGLK